MLIRRMYLSIKRECVALIFFLFCGFLFTETRKEMHFICLLTTTFLYAIVKSVHCTNRNSTLIKRRDARVISLECRQQRAAV